VTALTRSAEISARIAPRLGDLTRAHPTRLQRDDLVVEPGEPPAVFADPHWVETPVPITRDRKFQLAAVGDYGLTPLAVAVIA